MDMFVNQTIGKPAAHRRTARDDFNKKKYLSYFETLRNSRPTLNHFIQQWIRLPYMNLSEKEFFSILQHIKLTYVSRQMNVEDNEFVYAIATHWDSAESAFIRTFEDASPESVSKFLHACHAFKVRPSQQCLNQCFQFLNQYAYNLTLEDTALLLQAASTLKIDLTDTIKDRLRNEPLRFYGKTAAFDAINITWASAVMHSITDDSFYKDLFSAIKDRLLAQLHKNMQTSDSKKIHDSFMWFEGQSPVSNTMNTGITSLAEKQFVKKLTDLKYAIDTSSGMVPVFKQAIDFSVDYNGQRILIEIDGPSHHIIDSETGCYALSGTTSFRSALCHAQIPDSIILRLPFTFSEIWIQQAADAQRDDIEFIFDETLKQGAGTYHVQIDDNGLNVLPIQSPRNILKPHVPSIGNGRQAPQMP